MAPRA
jgi:DNA end-binding protein Ku